MGKSPLPQLLVAAKDMFNAVYVPLLGAALCSAVGAVLDEFCDPFLVAPVDPAANLRDCALADDITRFAFRCFQHRPARPPDLPAHTPADDFADVVLTTLDGNEDAAYVEIVLDMLNAVRGTDTRATSESQRLFGDALTKLAERYPSRFMYTVYWVIGALAGEHARCPVSTTATIVVDAVSEHIPTFRALLLKVTMITLLRSRSAR